MTIERTALDIFSRPRARRKGGCLATMERWTRVLPPESCPMGESELWDRWRATPEGAAQPQVHSGPLPQVRAG